MTLWGKSVRDHVGFCRTGILLIVVMGLIRFTVGAAGVPYEKGTHLASLTLLTFLLALIYGQRAAARGFGGYRHLLPLVLVLSATMYGFIILAILVEGLGGIHGYFHAPGMGVAPPGMSVGFHIVGQLLAMVLTTLLLWGAAALGFLLSRHLGFLRNAFLLLAAMALARFLVGAAGVPYEVGTWVTSLTLLASVLSVYYGYRARPSGFSSYAQIVVIGCVLAVAMTLLVVYGIAVATNLGVSNYFHAPGEGFQPEGISRGRHILGHLQVTPVAALILCLLAAIGFALGKRASPATSGAPR